MAACARDAATGEAHCAGEPLARDQLRAHLEALPLWELAADGRCIRRAFVAKGFAQAMAFLNAVAEVAERQAHHPDLHLPEYRSVAIELWTHTVGAVTMNDIVEAKLIDEIPVEYSPKWLREHPEAQTEG